MSWIVSLLLRPKVIIGVVIFVMVVSVLAMFRAQQDDLAETRAALEDTREMLAAAEDRLALMEFAREQAVETERVIYQTRTIVTQAHQEIADASARNDVHAMYVAWAAGLERVRDAAASGSA